MLRDQWGEGAMLTDVTLSHTAPLGRGVSVRAFAVILYSLNWGEGANNGPRRGWGGYRGEGGV